MRNRAELIARATELGCFDNPNERTDEQLHWAIEAEEASARWLNRFESLPTDEAKSAALRQLAHDFTKGKSGS